MSKNLISIEEGGDTFCSLLEKSPVKKPVPDVKSRECPISISSKKVDGKTEVKSKR